MHLFILSTRPTLTERLRDDRRTGQVSNLFGPMLHHRLPTALLPRLPQRALRFVLEGFRT